MTMRAFFPPSSSCVRFNPAAAFTLIRLPTSVEPVNDTAFTRGSSTSASPSSLPAPVMQLNTPLGKPARTKSSARYTPDQGVKLAGLKTTVLPVRSAGMALRQSTFTGKFHGQMTATTPSGWYCTQPDMPRVPMGRP